MEASNGQAGDQGRPALNDGVTVGIVDSASVKEVGDALVEVGQRDEADDHDDEGEGEGDQNTLLTTGELDLLVDLGSSLAVSLFGVLELLHREDGGTLVSLDLLGIVHHEDDGHDGGNKPQDGTEADDDGLVHGNVNAVEPRQPQPAPSRTVAAPTIGSKPAAIMVAASRA